MEQMDLNWVVLSKLEDVQWLTGVRFTWFFETSAAMNRDGVVYLMAPHRQPPESAADHVATYEAKWHSTLRNDQRKACDLSLVELVASTSESQPVFDGHVGCQYSATSGYLLAKLESTPIDIESEMYRLRRRKEADELMRLRKAIDATEKMYDTARRMIRPGVSEIEVFNALQTVAVDHLDEMLTGTGNDYQCGSRGGPPRGGRKAEAGELYILDLGPAYQGYFADNARTIAVSDVSDAQLSAWNHIMEAFQAVEQSVRPGVSCRKVFEQVQSILDRSPVGVFNHHLGHGIGLFPHEAPHLNPNWDDVFEVGDVFTAEPGLYAPELKAGMRIENDYLVTESGVECLTEFSLKLDE